MKKLLLLTVLALAATLGVIFLLHYFVYSDPVDVSVAEALGTSMIVPVMLWFVAPYSKKYPFTGRQAHISSGIWLGLLMVALFLVDYVWRSLSIRETLLDVFLSPIIMFLLFWMFYRFGLFSSIGRKEKNKE